MVQLHSTCQVCGHQQPAISPYCANCGSPMPGPGTGLPQRATLQQGRYVILSTVGRGGMGAVYQAEDQRLGGKVVAIKEMSDAAITSPQEKLQAVAAFRQEAQLLGRLDHRNIPKVSDFFDEDAKHYIVMEFVQGETLEAVVRRQNGTCSEQQVRDWARQLCDVLSFLHGQRPPVIFRDLKPANVMLTATSELKLIDFGIARFFRPGKVKDTLPMGTPGFAAPEQYGREQSDPRSDVYSLGVLLHNLSTGYDPSTTPFNLPPVRQLNRNVSAQMEAVIRRATETDKLQRYQSVTELCQDLMGAAADKGPSRGKLLGVLALVVALLMALTILFAGQINRRNDDPTPTVVARATAVDASPTLSEVPSEEADRGVGPVPRIASNTPSAAPEAMATPQPAPTNAPAPPTSTPTRRPANTPTPTPEPYARAAVADLNVRAGPSTDFEVVRRLGRDEEVQVTGRNDAGDWLRVVVAGGVEGWAASEYLTTELRSDDIAVVPTPTVPPCRYAVDNPLAPAYSQSQLGCAAGDSRIVWSAWQPFQVG